MDGVTAYQDQTTVWDPIEDQVVASVPDASQITQHPLDGFFRMLSLPILLGMMIGFFVGVFSETWRFYGLGFFCLGFVVFFAGDAITGREKKSAARITNAVAANGFLGGTKIPEAKVGKLARRIRSLMTLRVGGSIPLVLEHELWGETAADIPFWMGMSVIQSTVYGKGPKANIRSPQSGAHGEFASFIVAYQLDRDTRIRAEIMPEFATAVCPLDRDIKTESTEFNAKYNIRLTMSAGEEVDAQTATAELLQVLTPAFQTVMIGLAETYAARVIIDHDTVFFGGYRNMQTTDEAALAALLQQAIVDFADAATAFKTYAE
ncbi:MAG: hypothetical protein AAFU41_19015 [Pseudomonadota bacterium]